MRQDKAAKPNLTKGGGLISRRVVITLKVSVMAMARPNHCGQFAAFTLHRGASKATSRGCIKKPTKPRCSQSFEVLDSGGREIAKSTVTMAMAAANLRASRAMGAASANATFATT